MAAAGADAFAATKARLFEALHAALAPGTAGADRAGAITKALLGPAAASQPAGDGAEAKPALGDNEKGTLELVARMFLDEVCLARGRGAGRSVDQSGFPSAIVPGGGIWVADP